MYDIPEQPKRKKRRYNTPLPPPDPDNPAIGYFYIRFSRGHQGLSSAAQLRPMRTKLEQLGLTLGTARYNGPVDNSAVPPNPDPVPGVFQDAAISAFRLNLAERPGGKLLLETLKPGDFVMVARLDRMFRSMADFCTISDWFIEHQIRLIVCDRNIDLGSATGRLLARHLASLAQWESERRSERFREALAQKRLREGLEPETDPAAPRTRSLDLGSDYRPPVAPSHIARKPGRIFIYLRVSHRESAASGLGLADQLARAKAYAAAMMEMNPDLVVAEIFTDLVESAWKTNLHKRPAGAALCDVVGAGDHVVFSTLDRGFRSVRDMVNTLPEWEAKGVTAHFVGEGINMADPGGRVLATTIVQFAEYEAQIASERNIEARAILASQGRYVGGRAPIFRDVRRWGTWRQLTLNRDRLTEYRLLKRYRDGTHPRPVYDADGRLTGTIMKPLPLPTALERLESLIAKRDKRVAIPLNGAHPLSRVSAALPPDYERDARGIAYPVWTQKRTYEARKSYDDELECWRKAAAERRRLRRLSKSELAALGDPPNTAEKVRQRGSRPTEASGQSCSTFPEPPSSRGNPPA